MDNRRKASFDLEKKRSLFFRIGLVVSLGLVLVAFDWKTRYEQDADEYDWTLPEPDFIDEIIIVRKAEPAKSLAHMPPARSLRPEPMPVPVPDKQPIDPIPDPLFTLDPRPEPNPGPEPSVPLLGADRMPEYPGGAQAMIEYIQKHIRYPGTALRDKLEGTVYVSFVIDRHGKVTDVVLKHGVRDDLDREALRVMRAMPDWIAAENKGFPVSVIQVLPIRFVIVRD